ncbi:MaoC family dehydratase N-terminal domain-containing protein [Microbacterium sp. RD1]|uniref:MaoC family dehydratase N-terminal domain-containing protein n=1 Tax=Microbacterium sp. RD1 TaxID=3457313 RepID=UPI003FA5704A
MVTLDAAAVGVVTPPQTLEISRSRLRFFATATGQTDPVYTDIDVARAAGHPDLPVPPTFFFGIELESPDPFRWMTDLGIDLRAVLHGEQQFVYHRLAYAGDTVTARSEISDVYEKRGGALTFLVRVTTITGAHDEPIAELTATTVVRELEREDER